MEVSHSKQRVFEVAQKMFLHFVFLSSFLSAQVFFLADKKVTGKLGLAKNTKLRTQVSNWELNRRQTAILCLVYLDFRKINKNEHTENGLQA